MVEYHPFSERVMDDPHPVYRTMREERPAYHVEEFDCWALTRFEDVWNAAQDPLTYSAAQGTTSAHLLTGDLEVFPAINLSDPPLHTNRRRIISGCFTPGVVKRYEPAFRDIVLARLDAVRERGCFDVASTKSLTMMSCPKARAIRNTLVA